MKTKGLTRLDIIMGMQNGDFKIGDEFLGSEGEKVVVIEEVDGLALYWKTGANMGNIVQMRIISNELFDMLEKLKFKVDDVLIHPIEGLITVYKVIGFMVYYHTDKKTDWFDACSLWATQGKIRHATKEEIVAEKQRRWWGALNKEVNEYQKGDIVIGTANDLMEVVESDVHDGLIKCRQFHPHHQHFDYFNISKENVSLIVPVEKRLDLKGEK